jgi:hypothetical protein
VCSTNSPSKNIQSATHRIISLGIILTPTKLKL